MSTVLVLTSSALGDASVSNQLVRETLEALRARHPGLTILRRDLGAEPVPHLSPDAAAAIAGAEPANPAQQAARTLSDTLVAELRAADAIIIGAPMYNFGIASTLKSWFDHVLRGGVTFRYTENGPVGLLTGKHAVVIETRGGLYSEGPAQGMDAQEPHLRTMLGFIGITEITFVRAEKLALGGEAREQAIAAARTLLGGMVEAGLPRAA
jgi:FMN-dependent NADH-azoreductase